MRKDGTRICPRCKTKCLVNQPRCPECRLIFSRLTNLSNKEAKKALRRGEKIKVVYVKEMPADIVKWKVFLMCLVTGIFGGHSYYTGRYKRAIFISCAMIFSLGVMGLNASPLTYGTVWYDVLFYTFAPFGACILLFWGFDLFFILFERYKYPASIPAHLQQEYAKHSLGIEKAEKILKEKTPKNSADDTEHKEGAAGQKEEKPAPEKKQTTPNKKYANYNNTKKKGKKK